MAAFFAHKQGGSINVLKLSKLLYLSDRESIAECGLPISFDNLVSMPDGPVLSKSLNLINGSYDPAELATWEEWITSRANYEVGSKKRSLKRKDLDQLSDFDMEVLERVWTQFGGMDKYTIRDWTHKNCPEWVNPKGSSVPIDDYTVLLTVGRSKAEAKELAKAIQTERSLDTTFANL